MRSQVGFVSLGCPKNLVDTERMIHLLSQAQVVVTGAEGEADIIVINTCGFLEPAKNESMDTIGEFVQKKKQKKLKGVVVTGCMTERYLGLMGERYPEVDAFLQTKDFSKITDVIKAIDEGQTDWLKERRLLVGDVDQLEGHSELPDFVERSAGLRSYAYVKISEGCNRVCTFCIIPKLRGKHHSRSIEGVLHEVKQLVAQGTTEVIFIAQDLTSYGRDRADGASLLTLLKEVEKIKGLHWFRLMYNYPRFFSDELIDFLAKSKNFARYIDIPFQHASDSILRAMKRPESAAEIRTLITKLRMKIPGVALRTTVMVGFPGETEKDFEELLDFVTAAQFEHLGAFTYFREPNTPSFDLPDQVPEEVKQARYQKLMKLQAKIQSKKMKAAAGQTLDLKIDGFSEKTRQGLIFRARHAGQAPEIDGVTYVLSENALAVGDWVTAEVAKSVGDYDLLAVDVSALKMAKSAQR